MDDIDEEISETLKWNSIIADGVIMASPTDKENHIRKKIKDALSKKYPLIAVTDFEFVKVLQKKISIPELSEGTEFNFVVIKKIAGQGTLYVQLKQHCSYVISNKLDEDDDGDHVDSDLPQSITVPSTSNQSETVITSSPNNLSNNTRTNISRLTPTVTPIILPAPALAPVITIDTDENTDLIDNIKQQGISDPLEIMKLIQKHLHRGRPLFVTNILENQVEGEINMIAVDRDNILKSSFDELKYVSDYEVTFEVDFIGECAKDYGGPRLEWIGIMNRGMKEEYFDSDLKEHLAEEYFYVGIIIMTGISLFKQEQVNELLSSNFTASICMKEFIRGLEIFGLRTLFFTFPVLRHLFYRDSSSFKLSPQYLMKALSPEFSPEGSTARAREKKIYSLLVRYIREVGSGRRVVSLSDILQFVTGCDEEPMLGFSVKPTIKFVSSVPTEGGPAEKLNYTQTAHICANQLVIPRGALTVELPDDAHIFNIYDLAFANKYFGMI